MNKKYLCLAVVLVCIVIYCHPLPAKGSGLFSSQQLQELYLELNAQAEATTHLEQPPLGNVVKLTNNTKYAVVIWDAHTEDTKASFKALLSIKIPNSKERLLFYAEDIPFSNGAGITGKVKLYLADDITVLKGDVMSLTFKKKDTYAEIDCNGFDKMKLGMELELSRKVKSFC